MWFSQRRVSELIMKQQKYGEKIINWHKPLGRSQLRQRYLRHRREDVQSAKPWLSDAYTVEVDEYWNCYDPYEDYGYSDYGEREDLYRHNLNEFLTEILNATPPVILSGITLDIKSEDILDTANDGPKIKPQLEKRLSEYIHEVSHFSNHSDSIQRSIKTSIGTRKNLKIIKSFYSRRPEIAKSLCLFAPFWIRTPDTWDSDGQTSLLDHLFVLYDVPECLCSEWFRDTYELRFKWLCWFILFGQGGSLQRTSEYFQWNTPKKFQHFLMDVPPGASPIEACVFSEVKRLGGTERDFARIHRNPAFLVDPTEHSDSESFSKYWHDTLRWTIHHRDEMTDDECEMILSWSMHEYTEAERQGLKTFTWKGRRIRTVLDRSIQYRRQIQHPWSGYRWPGHGWDHVMEENPHDSWSFVELTSGEELYREGQQMKHCVASYAARCAIGHSAIFSVRHNGQCCVTVEINPRIKQVTQVRGSWNREADTKEQRAINHWMRNVVQSNTTT